MRIARLEQVLAAYGADPRRWPAAERDAALALIERSAEARARVAEARRLDRALDAAHVAVDRRTVDRVAGTIAARLSEPRPAGGSWTGFLWKVVAPTWSRGAALASVAVLGIMVGLSSDPALIDADGGYDGAISISDTSVMGAFSPWSE